jgi:long-chain acyl-CoA synthetase
MWLNSATQEEVPLSKSYRSVADMLLARVAATPDAEAFRFQPENKGWVSRSWKQLGEEVRALACGLRDLGLKDEQRVAILAGTRYEWVLADLAILCAGGATTTIYPSSTTDDCAYIIGDSATVIAIAENAAQVAKLSERRAQLPELHHVVVIDGQASADGWVLTLAELAERGRAADRATPGRYQEIALAVGPTSLATLIYTSGTTGRPKGVELTHDCWVYEGEGIDALGLLRFEDLQYLWLPLAHSFGKVLQAAQIRIGFATAIDGRVDKIVDNLAEVKPTFVAAVPRIFEKVHNKVVTGARDKGGATAAIFKWAVGVGKRVSALRQAGQEPGGVLALEYRLAEKLVFSKLQARFGGRLRFFISGSAPLARDLAEFFHAAGVLVLEGYGLTESSAATFVNWPHKFKFGTVGLPMPGTEVTIAADGEILLRGRGIMRGYHNLPEATREALDAEGYLHTGDIGQIEDGGFLRITDRKKDLIKTSGGKYVAPQALEGKLKVVSPYVSQVVVHGDNRNFCSALVTLDEEAIGAWAAQHGKAGAKVADLAKDPQVIALVQTGVDELNAGLASYETIKKFAILPAELTQEAGELTASLKVKRKAVEQKYKAILDALYTGPSPRGD